jgi:hypothetical protein
MELQEKKMHIKRGKINIINQFIIKKFKSDWQQSSGQ